MADLATAKRWCARCVLRAPLWIGFRFGRRRSIAGASVSPLQSASSVAAFALSAIAITFWYAGTKPGIVAVLLSSLIRGYIFEAETSSLSRVLYELVFLIFAILMIWVRRKGGSRS